MSMLDVDALRRLPGAMSPEEAGRFTPQPSSAPENPYQELDGRLKAEAPAVSEASANPYEELDSKFNAQNEGGAKGTLRQFGQGLKGSLFETAGGPFDLYSAGKEVLTQKPQEYGTGAKWAKRFAGVEEAPEGLPWYQRVARAEGRAAPTTALAAGGGALAGGPLGALISGAGAAGGVAASALASPYIENLTGLLPEHWRPAANITAGALLAHKVGGGVTRAIEPGLNMPTKMDIQKAGRDLYKKVDNSGIKVVPGTINNDIVDKSFADIGVGADINAPKTSAHLNALRQDPLGPSTDIGNLTERYKALGRVKIKNDGDEDYRAANIARGNIKSYLDNLPNNMNYVTDGHANVPDMFKNWTEANADWGAFKTINDIESRWTGAKFKARSTYTGVGSNDVNAINQAFRPIVDPNRPNIGRNYTTTQKDMVGNILYGSLPEKALRIWSKAAPDNAIGVAATAPGWLGALATGSPLPLLWNAVQAGGIPARSAAKYMQRRNIRALRDNVIQQSPLFKKMNPHIPHEGAEEEAGGIGAAAGDILSELPEQIHPALDAGLEAGEQKKEKKEEGGGYSMGHRLLKAVGGYDSSYFNGPYSAMRKYGIFGPAAVAGSAMGQQKGKDAGGYDDPRNERFADPQAFQLRMARLAAAPRIGVGGGQPYPQTAVGGGMPMGNYQVGGYNPLWGPKPAKSVPEPVDTGGTGSKYLFGSFSTVSKPHPPKGGSSMQDPQGEPDTGGYDGVTGLLDQLAAPVVAEHSQPWSLGRAAGVLGQALTAMGPRGGPEGVPPMADVISPTQFGAPKSPQLLAPQYSTGKSDRLPVTATPWRQIGGYRRRGGYGMGQVSPLAGGGGF